jgi:ABC-type transporter Mla MlaB component
MASAHTLVVGFAGPATIRQAEALATRLKDALAEASCIEIDCGQLTEVDLAFIQLIIAARRSAEATGKSLTVNARAAGCLADTLAAAGIEPFHSGDVWSPVGEA